MNHVWIVDFIHDPDERGRPLKWLSVVDEDSREYVAIASAAACPSRLLRTHVSIDVSVRTPRTMQRHLIDGVDITKVLPDPPVEVGDLAAIRSQSHRHERGAAETPPRPPHRP